MKSSQRRAERRRRQKATEGQDTGNARPKSEYYVANSLDLTPHGDRKFVARIKPNKTAPNLKYSVNEQQVTAGYLTSTTSVSVLSLAQGNTDITRIGDRIRIRRIHFAGDIRGASLATNPAACRVLLVCQGEPGVGAVNPYVAAQILQGSNSYLQYAPYTADYGMGYQVLADILVSANPVSATSEMELFSFDREVDITVGFTAGSTQAAFNDLRLLVVTNVTSNFPIATVSTTMWFEDNDS